MLSDGTTYTGFFIEGEFDGKGHLTEPVRTKKAFHCPGLSFFPPNFLFISFPLPPPLPPSLNACADVRNSNALYPAIFPSRLRPRCQSKTGKLYTTYEGDFQDGQFHGQGYVYTKLFLYRIPTVICFFSVSFARFARITRFART